MPGALALWGLAHGLVELELSGLLPGDATERAERYRSALLAVGAAAVTGVGRGGDGGGDGAVDGAPRG